MATEPNPICGWCNRPRLEDIDPATSIYLCPEHQTIADRLHGELEKILVPARTISVPEGWPAEPVIHGIVTEPSPFTGIITTAPRPEPATSPALDFQAMADWIRQLGLEPDAASLEEAILREIHRAIVPISPAQLAIQIARIARHYFWKHREPDEERTDYRIVWLDRDGGVVHATGPMTIYEAERSAPARVGEHGVTTYEIQTRRVEKYPDGATWTSPWLTVTSPTEETPDAVRRDPPD